LFITGIVVALMIGAVLVARVAFANATMELLADSARVAQSTELGRAEGLRLEVRYAVATNPAAIQEVAATSLGMSPDPRIDYLRISAGE
jgi:cell division protein FtsL